MLKEFYRGLGVGVVLGVILLGGTWLAITGGPLGMVAPVAAGVFTDTPRATVVVVVVPPTDTPRPTFTATATPTVPPTPDTAGETPTGEAPATAMPTVSPPSDTPDTTGGTPALPTALPPTPDTATAMPTVSPAPKVVDPVACWQEPGVIEQGLYFSTVDGRNETYRVYLPPCYQTEGDAFPVVYMFHGSIQNDSQWDDDGMDEAATAAIQAHQLAPFVIAMPAGDLDGSFNYSAGGPGSFEQVFLEDFMPLIERTYHVRTDRGGRAIGGLSRGAVWALEIAFRHPDLFLSVGNHSGAQSVAIAGPAYHPLDLARSVNGLEQLRIYMDTGETDWYREGVDGLHAILTDRGIPHTYLINPGSHTDAYWQAHVAEYVAFYGAPWSVSEPTP